MTFEQGEIILYQYDDGQAAVDVRLKDETVWLSLAQMQELFDRERSVQSILITSLKRVRSTRIKYV